MGILLDALSKYADKPSPADSLHAHMQKMTP